MKKNIRKEKLYFILNISKLILWFIYEQELVSYPPDPIRPSMTSTPWIAPILLLEQQEIKPVESTTTTLETGNCHYSHANRICPYDRHSIFIFTLHV